jgi:uncharacterized membrane protein YphA (DoxX/SURF4 family)
MSLIRAKARALIGAAVIADGTSVLRRPQPHEAVAAPLVESLNKAAKLDLEPAGVVKAGAVGQAVGGALIASSVAPRLGALATLAVSVPATLFGYRFWQVKDDEEVRASLRSGFFAHVALVGAALLILAGPTRGRCHSKGRRDDAAKPRRGCCSGRRCGAGSAATKEA